ncbi:hypothetical protein PHSY_005280 [Pseudozyma hubeiensis SY62]|uniref:Structure-specific endonuclease subunit SLX4 n=1 Tax=Pseudozyma hubeiensis (strain SY62) TaxID=1305764 RepID=R9P8H8_PSEHS|nr:hypothetical protein PHSY_005280 [Pseudozyma hubeiensis SY62]GAC97693.1 hypothetical protein PHSY_005280 [Pseudozyma hubeiensis SY62]
MIRSAFIGTLHCSVPTSSSPSSRCLGFLYPPLKMSRRSTRLSGDLASPSLTSVNGFRSNTFSTEAGSSTNPLHTNAQEANGSAIPDFYEWTTPALQAEVKRYGFKVSRKRSTLIDQLKAVYEALNLSKVAFEAPALDEQATEAEAEGCTRGRRKLVLPNATQAEDPAAKKGKGKGRKSDPFVLDASSDSDTSQLSSENDSANSEQPGDLTAQLELEAASATDGSTSSSDIPLSTSASPSKQPRARPRSPSSVSSSSDTPLASQIEVAVEPTPAVAQTMTSAIQSNPTLWTRILRYEPISFDEFVSIATQNGLEMDSGKRKDELRTWLDRQCICFYSNDLTGPRSRH